MITSLGEERANISAFRMFDRFVLVWICRFPLPLDVWEGLRFVIVALPGLFSYLFLMYCVDRNQGQELITLGVTSLDKFYNLPLMKNCRYRFLRNYKSCKVETRYVAMLSCPTLMLSG